MPVLSGGEVTPQNLGGGGFCQGDMRALLCIRQTRTGTDSLPQFHRGFSFVGKRRSGEGERRAVVLQGVVIPNLEGRL